MDINELKSAIEEIDKYYTENPFNDSSWTLPEIFSRQWHENFISSWLAYLFNPSRNGLGTFPLEKLFEAYDGGEHLKNLLEAYDEGKHALEDFDIEVEREESFSKGKAKKRRIDILIYVKKSDKLIQIIGIENKLRTGEGYKQTEEYFDSLKQIAEEAFNKKPVCIYLHPEQNPPGISKHEGFEAITYRTLVEKLKTIPTEIKRDARKSFYLEEFIMYAEEFLMVNAISNNEIVEIYRKHKKTLENAKEAYDSYARRFDEGFLRDVIERAFPSDADEYSFNFGPNKCPWWWQIFKPEWHKWGIYVFHYEIWKEGNGFLYELRGQEVNLCVQLEPKNTVAKKWFKEYSAFYAQNESKVDLVECKMIKFNADKYNEMVEAFADYIGKHKHFGDRMDEFINKYESE